MLELAGKLKQHNLKVTPQRLAIFHTLCNTTEHPSAETIYKSLKETHPTMSLATVYKTLDALVKAGLIKQINVGEDLFRYDANTDAHIHAICRDCNEVIDLPYTDITNIRNSVQSETDFDITAEELYFYGTCNGCKTNKAI